MAVIRVNKTKDYTVMSNCHLRDGRLSLKAKGLLSMMLSLSDEWSYSIAGLVAISKENESAIKSTLSELKTNGYLVVTKKMPNETGSGRIEYEYNIYEQPQEKQEVEKQEVENLSVEFLSVENQGQLNTNKLNTNISNTNILNTDDIGDNPKRKRFVAPTVEEVQAYCLERKNGVNAQRFIDYYTANGWMVGKNRMKDWKAAVRTWEKNGYDSQKTYGHNGIAIKQNAHDDLAGIF